MTARLVGCTEPRLFTPPLRRLTPATSLGFEVCEFAEKVLRQPLMPWQRWLVIAALELNPDGSFRYRTVVLLVARQNGKTHVVRVVTLWRLLLDGARLALGVAQDVSQAGEVWEACIETLQSVPYLADELEKVRRVNGDVHFSLRSGARYKIAALNADAGRGLTVDQLNMDELRTQRTFAGWAAVSKTIQARRRGQIWALSNAGDDRSVVLNQLREAALAGRDPSVGLFEWSAEPGCELDDPRAWAQANPALGSPTMDERSIRSSLATDPPAVFRTEVLCQHVRQLDGAVDLGGWQAGLDPDGSLEPVRSRVVAVIDVALDGGHATLAGAAVLPDGRVRIESFEAWDSASAARAALPGLLERIAPAAVGWFPSGPSAELAPEMRALGAVEIRGGAVNEACMGLAGLVAARRVLHNGDPLLAAHAASASKLYSGDGWRFTRRGAGHVDALYAAAGAVHLARTLPEEVPLPRPAVF